MVSRNKQKIPEKPEKEGKKYSQVGIELKKRRKKQWISRKFLQRLTTQY